jgi:hypothetical protein
LETPREVKEDCPGTGQQGGILKDLRHHSAGAVEELLEKIELCDREEKDMQHDYNSSQRRRQSDHGTDNTGEFQAIYLQQSAQEAVHPCRGGSHMQW